MRTPIFYSWQSDTEHSLGKELIHEALESAATTIAADTTIPHRPELDHDTRGVPGAPAIVAAILRKIDLCAVFVADLTLTHVRERDPKRKAPNPNVLLELGYALRRLGAERVLLVLDTAGGGPEQLPFDLRGSRVVSYSSEAAKPDRSAAVRTLAGRFETALRVILHSVGLPSDIAPPLAIELRKTNERIEGARHDYRLHVELINNGPDVVTNWSVELRFPQALLDPAKTYPVVGNPTSDGLVIMRRTEKEHSGPIYPGDRRTVFTIDYLMTHALYDRRKVLFATEVSASAFVDNKGVARVKQVVEELQCF